jgi:Tol biopolymer transport system component
MARGRLYLPAAMIASAVVVACVAAMFGVSQKAEASFPGKNGKIAFNSDQVGDAEIYKINPDGSGLKQVTNNTVHDYDPSWSPDGSKVAFWRPRGNGSSEIFVKNTTNGQLVQLTDSNDSMSDSSPSWSPDGSKIVFVSNNLTEPERSREIWVMNSDGSGRKRLTTNSLYEGWVVWSPDGSKIAFDTWSNENDIWVMNADGTNLQNLTNTSENTSDPTIRYIERRPTWSPDGSRIAFSGDYYVAENAAYASDIYAINADGSGEVNLTNTPTLSERAPAWSPNGRKIAFIKGSADFFVPDIWVMNADGTSPRNITNSSEEGEWSPDWQPLVQVTP